ncbi:MAG: HAD hydrolase-like protein [Chloroflexota bacterium]|nr:HAD hydrolase-like protein [Chloroflexota bacterium]
MTVKAALLDLGGTLLQADGGPVEGATDMISELRQAGIKVAVASFDPGDTEYRMARAGIQVDLVLDRTTNKRPKGTKEWVANACAALGIGRNEIVYLGDSDRDMREAVNSRVVYFNAGWSEPNYQYGVNVTTPARFSLITRECFAKSEEWFVSERLTDAAGRPARVHAMTDSRGGQDANFADALRSFLKNRTDRALGSFQLSEAVTLHLLGSIFGTGLVEGADLWTVYPGSKGRTNQSLAPFAAMAARLFRQATFSRTSSEVPELYLDDLLIRHTPAPDSGERRYRGERATFGDQINTVCLNERHRDRLVDKRIVVIDDFETEGFSLECARNLLLQAGAADVALVAIGKYPIKHLGWKRWLFVPVEGYMWDPFAPVQHDEASFEGSLADLRTNPRAPVTFRESCERMATFPS